MAAVVKILPLCCVKSPEPPSERKNKITKLDIEQLTATIISKLSRIPKPTKGRQLMRNTKTINI